MKKLLALFLMLICIVTTMTSCGTSMNGFIEDSKQSDDEVQWVLTHEETDAVHLYSDSKIDYEYDELGRLVGKVLTGDTTSYVWENFKYDTDGNIVSVTEKYTDGYFKDEIHYFTYTYDADGNLISETEEYVSMYGNEICNYYTYSYDDNGNCISKTEKTSLDYSETTYSYDSKGNIIKKRDVRSDDSSSVETISDYVLTYENDLCIQSEITVNQISDGETEVMHRLERFTYDEYNNKLSESYYSECDSKSETIDLEENGVSYTKEATIYYTWERLSDVAVEAAVSESEENYSEQKQSSKDTSTVKIGFLNIAEWGNKLIEIQSDDNGEVIFEDGDGMYVIIQEGTAIWEFYPEQFQVVMSSYYVNGAYSTEAAGAYTVLDNDTLMINEYAIRILDRFTLKGTNAVQMTSGGSSSNLYIPYSVLKIESIELYEENDRLDYYKCYLK